MFTTVVALIEISEEDPNNIGGGTPNLPDWWPLPPAEPPSPPWQDEESDIDIPSGPSTVTIRLHPGQGILHGFPMQHNITRTAGQRLDYQGVHYMRGSHIPIRPGFEFVGWFDTLAATGGRQYFNDTRIHSDTWLWARWEPVVVESAPPLPPGSPELVPANLPSGLFRIRNINGNFLDAVGDFSFGQQPSANFTNGTDLWYIVPVPGNAGFYTIESLGVRSANYGYAANLLTASTAGSAVNLSLVSAISNPALAHSQHWIIRALADNRDVYVFTNRQHPTLHLSVPNDFSPPALMNSIDRAGWHLEEHIARTFWGGKYYRNPSSEVVERADLLVSVSQSVLAGALSDWQIFEAGHSWNGISENVRVEVVAAGAGTWRPEEGVEPPAGDRFHVYVVMNNFFNTEDDMILGDFTSDGYDPDNPDETAWLHENWRWGRIRLSDGVLHNGLFGDLSHHTTSLSDRQKVFIHEIGHALKLGHPNEREATWNPVAIMNMGYASRRPNNSIRPTGYDRHNLIMKWGR